MGGLVVPALSGFVAYGLGVAGGPAPPDDGPVGPETVVTIDGVDYDGEGRAAARFLHATLTLSTDGYEGYSWVEQGCGPVPTWKEWMAVVVTIEGTIRFRGRIKKVQRDAGPAGWQFAYSCAGLRELADAVAVRSRDGSGEACYNMPPAVGDPTYVAALIGLTVGQIVADVLTIPGVAQALDAIGVGGYTGLPSTPALPAETMADLALLDIVPRQGVVLSGVGILNQVLGLVGQWHRKYVLWVRPDGVIRLFDVTAMPRTESISVPGDDGGGDDVGWPSYDRDVDGCYTQVQVVGRDIRPAYLSTKDGTLTSVQGTDTSLSPSNAASWTTADENAWRLADFTQPRDASDAGTLSGVTLTGCTVHSNVSTTFWSANFWNGRRAQIWLIKDAGGAQFTEVRDITNCSALAAGGTATVGWDATIPLQATDYTRYQIKSLTGTLANVGRRFLVRDKSTGDTGLNCFVGAHMVTAFPHPVAWMTSATRSLTSMPVAAVYWSGDGTANGYNSITIPIEVNPEQGSIVAAYPVVQPTATRAQLLRGYPKTYAAGKPTNFEAVVPYNAGDLVARYPPSGFAGRAHDDLGMDRSLYVPMPRWTWVGDSADMAKFARELHASLCDPVDSGSINFHGVPAFDFLSLGYSVAMALSDGTPSPWDGLNLAVRSVTLSWPGAGSPDAVTTSVEFSNKCRPFQGDSMFLHPAYGGDGMIGDGDGFAIQAGMMLGSSPFALPTFRDTSGSAGGKAGLEGLGADDGGAARYAGKIQDRREARRVARPGPREFQGDAQDPDAGKAIVVNDAPPPANPASAKLSERRRANGARREDDDMTVGGG